jgi:hypothetical protein
MADLRFLEEVTVEASVDPLYGEPVVEMDWIWKLPKALKKLHLHNKTSQGVMLRLLTPEEQLASNTDLLPLTEGDLVPVHLEDYFPTLNSFETNNHDESWVYHRLVSGVLFEPIKWSLASIKDFYSHLPSSLTHCSVAIPDDKSVVNVLKLLNATHLTSLRLACAFESTPEQLIPLPAHLESLVLEDWAASSVVDLFALPVTLTKLHLHSFNIFLRQGEELDDRDAGDESHSEGGEGIEQDDEEDGEDEEDEEDEEASHGRRRPQSRRQADEDEEEEEKEEDEEQGLTPLQRLTNLEELTVNAGEGQLEAKWFKQLPSKLRTLNIINVVVFRREGVKLSTFQWPAQLSSLSIEADHTDCSYFQWPRKLAFPSTLTHLHLGVYVENETHFERYKMPSTLKSLSIAGFVLSNKKPFAKLPRGLTNLCLSDDIPWTSSQLKTLPPNLKELEVAKMTASSRSHANDAKESSLELFKALPRSLTRLSAGEFSLPSSELPSNMTRLTFENVSKVLQAAAEKHLPCVQLYGDGSDRYQIQLLHFDTKSNFAQSVTQLGHHIEVNTINSAEMEDFSLPSIETLHGTVKPDVSPQPLTLKHLFGSPERFEREIHNPNWQILKTNHLQTLVLHGGVISQPLPPSLTRLLVASASPEALAPLVNLQHLTITNTQETDMSALIPPSPGLLSLVMHSVPKNDSGTRPFRSARLSDVYFNYCHYNLNIPKNALSLERLPKTLRKLEGTFQLRLADLLQLKDLRSVRVDALLVNTKDLASLAPKQGTNTTPRALLPFLPRLLKHFVVKPSVKTAGLLLESVDEDSLVAFLAPSAHTVFLSQMMPSLQQSNFEWTKKSLPKITSLSCAFDGPWNFIPSQWPSSLTSLVVPCQGFTTSTYRAMPHSLTSLSLCAGEAFAQPEALSRLPTSVHTLTIRVGETTDDLIAALPTSITRLTLVGMKETKKAEQARIDAMKAEMEAKKLEAQKEATGAPAAKKSTATNKAVAALIDDDEEAAADPVFGAAVTRKKAGAAKKRSGFIFGHEREEEMDFKHAWPPLPASLVSLALYELRPQCVPSNLGSILPATCNEVEFSYDVTIAILHAQSGQIQIPSQNRSVYPHSRRFPETISAPIRQAVWY